MFHLLAQSTLPPPDAIRQAAGEVVARPYYELGNAPGRNSPPFWWELMQWLLKPLEWLFESMEGLPDFVRWFVVILALALLLALIAHIVYTFIQAIRGPAARRARPYEAATRELNPAELEQEADEAGNAGDYIRAIRLLFRAALCRIESAEKKKLRPGCTNRELLRRYQATPLAGSLQRFVETIDNKWYGGGTCLQDDYQTCRTAHAHIRDYVHEPRPAIGA